MISWVTWSGQCKYHLAVSGHTKAGPIFRAGAEFTHCCHSGPAGKCLEIVDEFFVLDDYVWDAINHGLLRI